MATFTEVFVTRASSIRGDVEEEGLLVLRPGYVAFVPNDAAGGAFIGYASQVLPPAFADGDAYVRYLSTLEEADFDASVALSIERCGWRRLDRASARVVKKRPLLFGRERLSLSFEGEGETVRAAAPVEKERVQAVLGLLADWGE